MNTDELRSHLKQLHSELCQTETVDADQRELLKDLENDIHACLNREENQDHHYRGLSERLDEAVAQVEVSHPRITQLMRRAIDSLSYLGV